MSISPSTTREVSETDVSYTHTTGVSSGQEEPPLTITFQVEGVETGLTPYVGLTRGDFQQSAEGMLDWDEVVIPEDHITLYIDYPLTIPTEMHFKTQRILGGFTRLCLATAVAKAYQDIYDEEEAAGPPVVATGFHTVKKKGPYGIWGHGLHDLLLREVVWEPRDAPGDAFPSGVWHPVIDLRLVEEEPFFLDAPTTRHGTERERERGAPTTRHRERVESETERGGESEMVVETEPERETVDEKGREGDVPMYPEAGGLGRE
ncbi:hypothetical protein KIPB_009074 [Kipferlia bialata]|uniref:Uncharacterized protein n=1 Tax=Kipferlia bialata TaxID=797122 RepID=A0A9K3GL84_9EUKA|nr:hypothetical protein KIPB_009074 [Kipferlia bialata]|eukprot:g9074.t1